MLMLSVIGTPAYCTGHGFIPVTQDPAFLTAQSLMVFKAVINRAQ